MHVRIVGTGLPGLTFHDAGFSEATWSRVHVGVQRGKEVVDLVPGDASQAVFDFEVELKPGRNGGLDPGGPFVHGRPGARFVYLSWGDVAADGSFEMFRRAKLWLSHVDPALLEQASEPGRRLEGRLHLTDARGGPLCGGLAREVVDWRAEEA